MYREKYMKPFGGKIEGTSVEQAPRESKNKHTSRDRSPRRGDKYGSKNDKVKLTWEKSPREKDSRDKSPRKGDKKERYTRDRSPTKGEKIERKDHKENYHRKGQRSHDEEPVKGNKYIRRKVEPQGDNKNKDYQRKGEKSYDRKEDKPYNKGGKQEYKSYERKGDKSYDSKEDKSKRGNNFWGSGGVLKSNKEAQGRKQGVKVGRLQAEEDRTTKEENKHSNRREQRRELNPTRGTQKPTNKDKKLLTASLKTENNSPKTNAKFTRSRSLGSTRNKQDAKNDLKDIDEAIRRLVSIIV